MANPINVVAVIDHINQVAADCRKLPQTLAELNAKSDADLANIAAAAAELKKLAKDLHDLHLEEVFDEISKQAQKIVDNLAPKPPNKQAAAQASKAANDLLIVGDTNVVTKLPAEAKPGGGDDGSSAIGSGGGTGGSGQQGDPADLKQFFENVSTSLIRAQTALNKSSLDYVSALDPRLPPAYYGIPSVKADMRVGINKIVEKGINLIFINNSTSKSEYAESTISFEIVGAPPPPGPVVYGHYVVPMPRLLVVGEQRAALIDKLIVVKKLGQIYLNNKDTALVLRYEPDADTNLTKYLVVWPGWKKKENLPTLHTQWEEISVFYIEEDERGGLSFPIKPETDAGQRFPPARGFSIFEDPTAAAQVIDGVLIVKPSTVENLVKLKPDMLARMVVNLGDVVLNFFLLFNYWLDAVTYRPTLPASPPGGTP